MNIFLKRTRTEKAFINEVWQCEIFSQLMLWRKPTKEGIMNCARSLKLFTGTAGGPPAVSAQRELSVRN